MVQLIDDRNENLQRPFKYFCKDIRWTVMYSELGLIVHWWIQGYWIVPFCCAFYTAIAPCLIYFKNSPPQNNVFSSFNMFHVEKRETLNNISSLSKGMKQGNEWNRTLTQSKLTNTPAKQAELWWMMNVWFCS